MSLNKNEIPVGDEQEQELTDAQSHQVDRIHNAAYTAMVDVLFNIQRDPPKWDMEWIGELCDAIADIAERHFGIEEMEVYPYMDN